MATTLFLLDTIAETHLATDNLLLSGASTGWTNQKQLGTARGSGVTSLTMATVTGPTSGIEFSTRTEWISPPLSADVTISGTMTFNVWAQESSMNANAAINVVVEVIRANALGTRNSNTLDQIVKTARTTELGFSGSNTVQNFTATPTSTAVNRGDRLRIRIFADDAGTMATGFTVTASWNGTTGAADGDTFVTFTENFSFESAPGGTVIYLTDTASDVSTASVDREAWTSRGSGVVNDVTNTAAGFLAPVQVTDTAGGTVVDWFTRQLQAVTLSGLAQANIRAQESNVAANASLRLEVARVESDGSSPTVWGSWSMSPDNGRTGELNTAEAAETINISGDDLAITDGQRLRIRLYIDDYPTVAMGASQTVTSYYNGTSGGASGDSFITFPVTLSEFTPSAFVARPQLVAYQQAVRRNSVW